MRYEVTIDGYVLGGPALEALRLGPIPGTTQKLILDTRNGAGQVIWDGYQEMLRAQSDQPTQSKDWTTIKTKPDAPEIDRFQEAINIFCRFLAGESRDNCNRVTRMTSIEDNV